ncbi:sporulation histidine kinase inhibitor Sda [Heyndrickxia acidicola]|uniref:Sporulation histidine kinase inhibitor Sda n=1 Tax=Heyndrickxia acidicola TaxID=209389 RepID=A0ABU6MKF6_9BACI|nr:sporulation histidine kinase inhibitor Sda [Heyndrickxia acidicola]MED1204471.1 sporulation histidine kinase inhibitor Sda [Heyndrickxia acidicola]
MKSLEKLSDESLLTTYKKARGFRVKQDFLDILKEEIAKRNLHIK